MGSLHEKTVVVTGAGAGIGEATARHLLSEGANVVATVRSKDSLEIFADVADPRLHLRVLDVRVEAEVEQTIAEAVDLFGRLDGIVNNAGVLVPGTILDATTQDFELTFEVNVRGVFYGCKYAVPHLISAGGGSIVNIGSINSLAAEKKLALYTASKGAVLMLTRAIALDFGGQGIRANAVCPGFVDTKLNVPHYTVLGGRQALDEGLADGQPIGRAIEPLEIAQSVAFLLSDASKAITGTDFVVDGGVLCKA
jgi:meso-butanediol dehydrogenase/(S,S)-butanediol dehydrogenase/diacetyl reductase